MQARISYPHRVEHRTKTGTYHVTIYETPNGPKNGPKESAFTLAWYECAKRKRKMLFDAAEAIKEAKTIAERLAGGELRLSPDEARIYNRSIEAIAGIGMTLDDVCQQFAEAWKRTGGKVAEAALDFSRRDMSTIIEKSLTDAVKEYLEAREKDVSAHYLREYDAKLNALSESFVGYAMAQMEPHRIDDYLRGLEVSSRTRKNARAVLLRFFTWAKTRRYLPHTFDFKEGVATVKAHEGEIEIYTPDELRTLFTHASDPITPFLALGAFAGLRHAEIGRLDWAQIDFKSKHIEIKAANAKTRSRRLVPLLPVLKKWLQPYAKQSGRVCTRENMGDALLWLAEKAGMKWKHNGLRHSFISYRLATTKNESACALEAGNSPNVIFRNYRELVKPKQARQWFNILPGKVAANVVHLRDVKAVI